jgi:hypothetical protein
MSTQESAVIPPAVYPIRQVVTDDLARNRVTAFFRLILAIPHLVWLGLWSIAGVVIWFVDWIWTLVAGQSPDWAHGFFAALSRYTVHVSSYLFLAAEPFPRFMGDPGYRVDLQIDPPAPQRRLLTLFRPILAIPMLIVAGVLRYLMEIIGILAWFYILATGRMHEGMRNFLTFAIAFNARTYGYLMFLTDRYPPFSERGFPTS